MKQTVELIKSLGSALLDLFFPPSCAGCEAPLFAGELCEACADISEPVASPKCTVCSLPFRGAGEDHLCGRCIESRPHFASAVAAFHYAGAIADGVTALKYGGRLVRLGPLARLWRDHCGPLPEVDFALAVPLHVSKLRQRSFNQSVLLAKPLLRQRGIPLLHGALTRVRAGRSQAGLPRSERLVEPRGAYELTPKGVEAVEGRRVLVIDDIMTTGATTSECARVLSKAGAEQVHAAVLARAT